MPDDIFSSMQSAVDIVQTSEHPTNKIAAAISGQDAAGKDFSFARVNGWPEPIKTAIGMEKKIGGSSGTIHAETRCLIDAPMTDGSLVFVTDPPCPNCVKNMAEAGVKNLYIDHKGFDKDFAARRGEDFRDMSIRFCEKAGISVFKIFRKEKKLETILEIPADYAPPEERPANVWMIHRAPEENWFHEVIHELKKDYDRRSFAAAVGRREGKDYVISAEIHAVQGFTAKDTEEEENKYNHFLQPVHRVMMTASRYGLQIDPSYLFSSRAPTAREQVNMIGAGLNKIIIDHRDEARDEDALEAFRVFTKAKILKVRGLLDIE